MNERKGRKNRSAGMTVEMADTTVWIEGGRGR